MYNSIICIAIVKEALTGIVFINHYDGRLKCVCGLK